MFALQLHVSVKREYDFKIVLYYVAFSCHIMSCYSTAAQLRIVLSAYGCRRSLEAPEIHLLTSCLQFKSLVFGAARLREQDVLPTRGTPGFLHFTDHDYYIRRLCLTFTTNPLPNFIIHSV